MKPINSTVGECSLTIKYGTGLGVNIETVNLPCYPDSISDSTQAQWNSTSILSRSVPLTSYMSTGFRNIGFNIKMHRELENGKDSIEKVLTMLKKTVYPKYLNNVCYPPQVQFVFGAFGVYGYVSSVSHNWQKPIINGKYQVCDVSIQITGIPSSYYLVSASESSVFGGILDPEAMPGGFDVYYYSGWMG